MIYALWDAVEEVSTLSVNKIFLYAHLGDFFLHLITYLQLILSMICELEKEGFFFRAMIVSILAALLWQRDRNERMKKTANFESSTDISWVKPCCLLCVIIRSDPLNANFTVVYKRRSVSRYDYVKDVVSTQDE